MIGQPNPNTSKLVLWQTNPIYLKDGDNKIQSDTANVWIQL